MTGKKSELSTRTFVLLNAVFRYYSSGLSIFSGDSKDFLIPGIIQM